MPEADPNAGSPVSRYGAHPFAQERDRLLHLRAREVGAHAIVDAGAECQHPRARPLGKDVEAVVRSIPSRLACHADTSTIELGGNVTPR